MIVLAPLSGLFVNEFMKAYKSLVLLMDQKYPLIQINRKEYFIMLLPVMF